LGKGRDEVAWEGKGNGRERENREEYRGAGNGYARKNNPKVWHI